MNMFIGAVVITFAEARNKGMLKGEMEGMQQQYVNTVNYLLHNEPLKTPVKPVSSIAIWQTVRMKCYSIVLWDAPGRQLGYYFDRVVLIVIAASVLVLCADVWHMPTAADFPIIEGTQAAEDLQDTTYLNTLHQIEFGFIFVFQAELVFKLTALGFAQYFESRFNQFDFLLVILNIAMLVVLESTVDFNPNSLRVARAFRAIRVLRSSKNKAGILRMIETLVLSLPGVLSVAIFLFLFMFIYALIGVQTFGGYDLPGKDEHLNRHANFATVGRALLTLFRMVTGESWNGLMHDCMEHNYWVSLIFFQSWMIIGSYCMFNMLIAIIIDQFMCIMEARSPDIIVKPPLIDDFLDVWHTLDPYGTRSCSADHLKTLVQRVGCPLGCGPEGVGAYDDAAWANDVVDQHKLRDMQRKLDAIHNECGMNKDHQYHFVEVFAALAKLAHGRYKVNRIDQICVKQLVGSLASKYPRIKEHTIQAEDLLMDAENGLSAEIYAEAEHVAEDVAEDAIQKDTGTPLMAKAEAVMDAAMGELDLNQQESEEALGFPTG